MEQAAKKLIFHLETDVHNSSAIEKIKQMVLINTFSENFKPPECKQIGIFCKIVFDPKRNKSDFHDLSQKFYISHKNFFWLKDELEKNINNILNQQDIPTGTKQISLKFEILFFT